MTANWILGWWNLIYVLPFGLALLYLGLYTLTGIGGAEHDADVEHDIDHDVDVDADMDHDIDADGDLDADAEADFDADADADADADVDSDADSDAEHESASHGGSKDVPFMASLLSFLGVGRAPVGLILMILFISWGVIGFATNNAVRPVMPQDWMVALISLPLAAIGSVSATSGLARLIGRYAPTTETSAQKRRELCGNVGEAMYDITETFGMCAVRDRYGNHFQLACRAGEGQPAIAKGRKVLLVRFDESNKLYTVRPYDVSSNEDARPINKTMVGTADAEPMTPPATRPESQERVMP